MLPNQTKPNQTKPYNWLFTVLLTGIISTMLLLSCKKDQLDANLIHDSQTINTFDYKSIKAFTQKALKKENVDSRSSQYFERNEASEFLEAALNFAYCRIDTVYDDYVLLKDTHMITVINDTITESDLLDLFDDISLIAGEFFYDLSMTDKEPHLFGVDISPTVHNNESEVYIQFIVRASGHECATGVPYGVTEFWTWGSEGGKCDIYSGGAPCDAAKIFTADLNIELVEIRSSGRAFYYTKPEIFCFHVGDDCDSYDMPVFIYDFYLKEGDDFDYGIIFFEDYSCLTPNDMNFHYAAMRDDLILEFKPAYKTPSAINVGFNLIGASYLHSLGVVYALKNFIEETEDEDPTPLPTE